jgi:hypothetical protein
VVSEEPQPVFFLPSLLFVAAVHHRNVERGLAGITGMRMLAPGIDVGATGFRTVLLGLLLWNFAQLRGD